MENETMEPGDLIFISANNQREGVWYHGSGETYYVESVDGDIANLLFADWWGDTIRNRKINLKDWGKITPVHCEFDPVKITNTIDGKETITEYKIKDSVLDYKKGDKFIVKDCCISSSSSTLHYGESYTRLYKEGEPHPIERKDGEYNFTSLIGSLIHNRPELFEITEIERSTNGK